jgi:signal transduction histidine kinase
MRVHLEEALRYPEDADPQVALQEALRATERLQAIVTDLLLLAQLGTGEAAPHGLVDLTGLVAAETGRRSSAHIRTALEQQITVLGDRAQLTRLLSDLLDNAERHARTIVDVRLCWHDAHAVLAVTDDGAGIRAEDRLRVFEPFARLDSARDRNAGGAGLGLTIAGEIALAHHGTLTIEDSPRGARFALRIPLADTGPGMRCIEIRR